MAIVRGQIAPEKCFADNPWLEFPIKLTPYGHIMDPQIIVFRLAMNKQNLVRTHSVHNINMPCLVHDVVHTPTVATVDRFQRAPS
ncbi:hypothetical protein CCACVL1_19536 [Corchorus capsularis]|uniref:Uncharacterized protein n=1 Tax=Corchorus capsularis TaxID=210143 RepID=A0A1R3HGE5_COCAP|nr:hypothetical protein CCACVL1_19536 [Corchorus capsularis]